MSMQLGSKISNLCGSDPPMLQSDGRPGRRMDEYDMQSQYALCTKVQLHRAEKRYRARVSHV